MTFVEESFSDLKQLMEITAVQKKLDWLYGNGRVSTFFRNNVMIAEKIKSCKEEEAYFLTLLIALGQAEALFHGSDGAGWELFQQQREELFNTLKEVELIYQPIGGIVGYHITMLKLIAGLDVAPTVEEHYDCPPLIDISSETSFVKSAIRKGLEKLPTIGEIYPIGGAGDRLQLMDSKGHKPLPAALLPFCGRSLFELLIRDLQAREYLYYKLYGKQVTVPLAMMTSHEKDNDRLIKEMLEHSGFFGRTPESFFTFVQPSVPVITVNGDWVFKGPFELMVKPGGHGVIWRAAMHAHAFDWMEKNGCKKALVRQINNPMAGTDSALLAFTGIGCGGDRLFGFASCPRLVGASEGMDVLKVTKDDRGYHYAITNVEYTDFKKKGIQDCPEKEGSCYSRFPANTNILFIDLDAVSAAEKKAPLPGLIVNMKTSVNVNGKEVKAGRLESTMQNVADEIVTTFDQAPSAGRLPPLKSFITSNKRLKTLSVTKRAYKEGEGLLETPEGCFYELMNCNRELFEKHCGMKLPAMNDEAEYLKRGPSALLLFHPALGPLWSIISQKVRGGRVSRESELQLEIAELLLDELTLNGSLLIEATALLGHRDEEGMICYSEKSGKCWLEGVTVKNKGINREKSTNWWKNGYERDEALHIVIHGDGEFYAKDVTFSGDERIEVPAGVRIIAYDAEGEVAFKREAITSPSWFWRYQYGEDDRIVLSD